MQPLAEAGESAALPELVIRSVRHHPMVKKATTVQSFDTALFCPLFEIITATVSAFLSRFITFVS
jgi:hypothetical protein